MKQILIVSLNSGGTMGHGKIISSLANFLSERDKKITIISDMPFANNFNLHKKVKLKNIAMIPHENYTIGGMCNCTQKDEIYNYAKDNLVECVIFSTFFDLELVKKFKLNKIKTILLSYPIRDTYRLALKQNGAYAEFDRVITLYGPEFNDGEMPNEILVNPLEMVRNKPSKNKLIDILVTCGGGGRPSSKIFLRKVLSALKKVVENHKDIKIKLIQGNSKLKLDGESFDTIVWTKDFSSLLLSSKVVISETGFYTMLDLINLRRKAILIPGERIIDNQELRALKFREFGIGEIFFPFEKTSKLVKMIEHELELREDEMDLFEKALSYFKKYPELGQVALEELK